MTTMFEVTHEELRDLTLICYKVKKPLFIWGATGIGKSRVMKELAKDNQLQFIDQRLSQLDPSDLRGLPKLDGERTKWLPPDWLPNDGDGILFLDELNLAPPSIQASAYELILDRRLGGYKLPDGWVVLAAGNRFEDKANVFEMPAPLLNRFMHVELKKPIINPDNLNEGWTSWALKNQLDTRVVNFLIKNTTSLFKFDGTIKEKAFPTPRAWETVSDLIKGINSNNLYMLQMLTSAAVGEGTAIKFSTFIKLGRKINLMDIFKNPKKIQEIQDVDMKYAFVNEATSYYQNNKKDNKDFVSKISGVIKYLDPEFSIRLIQICSNLGGSHFTKALVNDKDSDEIVIKYSKYLYSNVQ